jgi:DNA-binding transcriptional ArsR family regulator
VVADALNEKLVSKIAAAIGEPARARMLYCLMDSRARTSTELAIVADVSLPTASAHLNRLKAERLVRVRIQGRHRYYTLDGVAVADVLEKLSVLAGGSRAPFTPSTPNRLREARTCYDHIAGSLGVSLHDRLAAMGWLSIHPIDSDESYELTSPGADALAALGLDLEAARVSRRKFAFACLDWSERRSHVGGALGAALLRLALNNKWVALDLDSRALRVTDRGRRELLARFGLRI